MSQVRFFFSGWEPLVRIVVVGIAMYVALVTILRVSRSRTLSDMNAFDFVITVAIGSAFGRALTAKSVALAEAVVAFGLLVALQYVVTWLQIRWSVFRRAVKNPPALLYFRGEFVEHELRRQRVTPPELRSAARKHGFGSLDEIDAVVLESSGDFAVVGSIDDEAAFRETLDDVELGGGDR